MTDKVAAARRDEAVRSRGPTDAWVLSLVCACQFMVILDTSIINVALPSIEQDLGFAPSGVAWVVNGYLLTFAGLMLFGGRVADLFGQRRVLTTGLAVFSAASLVAGLATTPSILVGARVVQGAGAALMAPATMAVLATRFVEPRARARAFGAWSAAGGVGGMAGALAGGVLTTALSWRWVFLVNVPIGAVLISVSLMALARVRPARRGSLDHAGAVLATTGLAALVYGLMQSADHAWKSTQVVGPVLGGMALLVAFVLVEARLAVQPMIPLRLFGIRRLAVGNLLLLVFGGVAIAMWFFTALFLQHVLALSAMEAGLGQTPAAVIFMLVARVATPVLPRLGAQRMLLAGGIALFVGFGWLAQADETSSYFAGLLGPTVIAAVGIGLVFPTLMSVATADAPEGDAGIAGGLASTAHQVGGAIALAVLASTATTVAAATEPGGAGPDALAAGYAVVFLIAAGLGLAIAAGGLLLRSQPTGDRP